MEKIGSVFVLYSPDNTKGSVSNRSVRLNVQLLLWMLWVLMMVRFDRSSCCSLYLSWGCRSWSRGLTRCRWWEIRLLLPWVQHRRRRGRRCRGRSCRRGMLLYGMDRGRRAGMQVMLRVVVVMEVRRREVRKVVVMVVVVTCCCRRRTAIVSRHHFCVGCCATKRHSKKCPLIG